MKVYIELIMLDNFFMDLVLCYIAVRICGLPVRPLRLCTAAAAGGAYAVLALAYPGLLCLPAKLAVSAAMAAAASGLAGKKASRPGVKRALACMGCLYAAAFVAGGAVTAIMNAFGITAVPGFIRLPYLRWTLAGAVAAIVLCEWLVRRSRRPNGVCAVTAVIAGERIELQGFVDTGNAIKDAGGGGVVIADEESVLAQISEELREDIMRYPQSVKVSMRPFAFDSVGGSGTLRGIMPQSMEITCNGSIYEARAYIALASGIYARGCDAVLSKDIRLFEKRRRGRCLNTRA